MFTGRPSGETYRVVPDRLWSDPRIDGLDVKLWCALAFLARGRAELAVTDAVLAEKTRKSERTVRAALGRLEDAGFISRRRDGEVRMIALHPDGDETPNPEFTLKIVGA